MPSQPGTLWTVFELSGTIAAPTITARNEMGVAQEPGDILVRLPPARVARAAGGTDGSLIGRATRALEKASDR